MNFKPINKLISTTILVLIPFIGISQETNTILLFNDYKLTFEQRVNDLVGRLTLEEKVSQMLNSSPAIARLGIPAYDWWNETLHGIARTPFKTTVYPQAIAMAATFDKNSLATMADYSALEGRAIYNKAIASGTDKLRYVGLTYWTPNINIFRDPRWGRGQETYGEDPYLTAILGEAFVKGLQGDDAKYLKAAACAKHYAVHSGPEPSRHVFNVDVSPYDLWDTYLPAFKKLVVDAKVAGVMCAYNAFRTQPCCASDILMTDILRKQWDFTGYVTSDCWAIDDFYKNHKTHPDAATASADAVFHGTDIDCGTDAYKALVQAVNKGLIPESQIDISVKRLFMIRFRLGMFDPAAMVKYAQTPESVIESPAHQAHALKMARQSIVLLKNENHILPLKKDLKKIVVLGPNADNPISILGNYNGIPSQLTTVLNGIKGKLGKNTDVVYEQAVNFTNDSIFKYFDVNDQYSFEGKKGFKVEYFNNKEFAGKPEAIAFEKEVKQFWQEGEAVIGTITAKDFTARYTTNFTAKETGSTTFEIDADDAYRLIVNDKLVLNIFKRRRLGKQLYTLKTQKDSVYKMVVEYLQEGGKANVSLHAGYFDRIDFNALANSVKDADAVVFVGGISPQLEGEEFPINFKGFKGGDRTSILLPEIQTELMKTLHSKGVPVVFVMMTGSAIATPWESEHIPAIVNVWYGGQSAGTAVADVLFGDYNPAGRLPITFYKSDSDLASINDYTMDNRTYRYFKGKPLYGFGFGLSYTKFKYSKLSLPKNTIKGKDVGLTVTVKNSGKLEGEEVVQLYVTNKNTSIKAPLKSLKGFSRINLKAGESKVVRFTLSPEDLSYINANGETTEFTGKLTISVGGSQPNEAYKSSSSVIEKEIQIL